MEYVTKRGESYYYRRRVPEEVKHLDQRREVKISLKTTDAKQACIKADIYNEHIEEFWAALIESGEVHGMKEKYQAAVKLAKAHGFTYKPAKELAKAPLGEIIDRLEKPIPSKGVAEALLGGAEVPEIKLSESIELYWPLCITQLQKKNDVQKSKWKNPKRASMLNFISVVGDKAISKVERADVLKFRQWWIEKIALENKSSGTANKQFIAVRNMIKEVALQNDIEIDADLIFAGIKLAVEDKQRPPFEIPYVQNVLLPAIKDMNDNVRYVTMIMADTGMRNSEVISRCKEDIILDEPIPYVWIRANKNTQYLKTKVSERKIPLVGNALYAFKQRPDGFNNWGNSDSYSTQANKYLTEHNLRPTPQHSVYSLRHTFKDRLRDVEAPEEIIDELMGHKSDGVPYGRGRTLEAKMKWMKKIAFAVVSNNQSEENI